MWASRLSFLLRAGASNATAPRRALLRAPLIHASAAQEPARGARREPRVVSRDDEAAPYSQQPRKAPGGGGDAGTGAGSRQPKQQTGGGARPQARRVSASSGDRARGSTSLPPALRRPSASKQRGGPVRVAKALADAGVASRRSSEALVFAGRVRINGEVCMTPQTLVTPGKDTVEVDGAVVQVAAAVRHYYFALYKPVGYLCSSASQGEKLVLDLFTPWLEKWKQRMSSQPAPAQQPGGGAPLSAQAGGSPLLPPRLFTVGRLDTATSGLILVTNDGTWAQKIAHPSSGVSKEYVVTSVEPPTKRQILTMAEGCDVEGAFVKPLRVEKVTTPDGGSPNRVLVELCDGRNHEVRILCEHAGVDVKHLKRVRVGGLRLPSSLKPGQYQELTFKEAKTVIDADAQEAARGFSLAPGE